MSSVNNFITDILDQMADRDFFNVMFVPVSSGAYMASSRDGKINGRRVHAGDEFIADMEALGIDALKETNSYYFMETDNSNVFHRFRLHIEPFRDKTKIKGSELAIHMNYIEPCTEAEMKKELSK